MILNILSNADASTPRSILEIHTALDPAEEKQLLEGNIYLDLAIPFPLPIALYKQPQGSIPSNVRWRKDKQSEPTAYKPFFFPRNPIARTESHFAGKTALYLRIPGILQLGYINSKQINQLQAWYRKIEPLIPELLLSSGKLTSALAPQHTVIHSKIQATDQALETGIALRALDL